MVEVLKGNWFFIYTKNTSIKSKNFDTFKKNEIAMLFFGKQ